SRVLLPALSWRRAVGADIAARAVVSVVPGPTDMATRFVLYRQWDIPADTATAAVVLVGFLDPLSELVLPLIATIGIIVASHTMPASMIWLTIICVVVLALAMALIVGVARSESFARRLGDWLQKAANGLWGVFHRTPPSGVAAKVMDVRERTSDMLTSHGLRA